MKKVLSILVIFLSCSCHLSTAQKKTTILGTILKKIEDNVTPKEKENNSYPEKKPIKINTSIIQTENDEVIKIPILFHFVHKDINLLNEQAKKTYTKKFYKLITLLNEGFNEVNPNNIDHPYNLKIGKANIQFYIPTQEFDENCKLINPISFHNTSQEFFVEKRKDPILKNNGYVNSEHYLNVWICDLREAHNTLKIKAGYATKNRIYPTYDGVVFSLALFNEMEKTQKYWSSHEIGHYLGLEHIWGTDDELGNIICSLDDGISDTPRQNGPTLDKNGNKFIELDEVKKICLDIRDGNYQNFMDYSAYVEGMFTKDQVKHMRDYIKKNRSGLLIKNNCNGSVVSTIPTIINTNNSETSGSICIANPNYYNRKVVLTHKVTSQKFELFVNPQSKGSENKYCLYELPLGIYRIEVYTTFTNSRVESFETPITSRETKRLKLDQNGYN